ncbi:glycosyltransferase family 1 protein [Carboxylicivirga sp. A043]|uniref:glycosyltransferase family protein n=1 Tax=Carboxylicivirga litoralis TaxID=2816963 RepID=UPI0021CB2E70|nr:glycosyltransferase [Carboxylicivirga sp. A043]MCU4156681.1 glycosyltransferase family 1 protein [Carboxylicivirga sp. A043]
MSYRLVKITSYYKDFLSYYYINNPKVKALNYEQQHAHLMQQRFAWSDAYAFAFRQMWYDAHEIVANARPLQEQWCEENNSKPENDKEILVAQLKQLKPEVIWLQDSYSFNGDFIEFLKRQIPSIKLAIGNCCSPISPQYYSDFKAFDLITVCAPYFKDLLESNGLPECIVVPHAFDSRILDEVKNVQKNKHDFLFTGSLILDQNFHKERIQLLENLVKENVGINLLINLNTKSSKGLAARQIAYVASRVFKKTGLNVINDKVAGFKKVSKLEYFPQSSKVSNALLQKIKEPVFAMEMFKEIAQSKIAFNIHGDIAKDFAANMRMYEVTGMGSCLLTDWKPDLELYFKKDELVSYQSIDEAKEKITWLLNNPAEMEAIAQKGQQRTLREHTFGSRAAVIDEAIQNKMKSLG